MKPLLTLLTTTLLLSSCQSPAVTVGATAATAAQSRLIAPLTQSLDAALAAASRAHTPDEAEQLVRTRFYAELANRQIAGKTVQLQVQAQLTPQGQIQIQAQAQLSDQQLTAQAQRQTNFDPA